jgi:hypothetical protein
MPVRCHGYQNHILICIWQCDLGEIWSCRTDLWILLSHSSGFHHRNTYQLLWSHHTIGCPRIYRAAMQVRPRWGYHSGRGLAVPAPHHASCICCTITRKANTARYIMTEYWGILSRTQFVIKMNIVIIESPYPLKFSPQNMQPLAHRMRCTYNSYRP